MGSMTNVSAEAMYLDLCREHRPYVHNFVKKRVGNSADAEEIVQEVFLRAFSARERLAAQENPRLWLTGTAKNVIREYAKSSAKQARAVEGVIASANNIGAFSAEHEQFSDLFDGLSAEDRAVLRLYSVEGYTVSEVAKMLSIREDAARKRLSRARKKLEKILRKRNLLK